MADVKISQLVAVTAVTDDDLLVVVDAPGGTPATRKVTAVNARTYFAATVPSSAQTASYTLVLADAGKAVTMTVATANTLTVPPASSVAFPVGTVVGVEQLGAGTTTVTAGAGVTLRSRGSLLALAGQYAVASARYLGSDVWIVTGDLA